MIYFLLFFATLCELVGDAIHFNRWQAQVLGAPYIAPSLGFCGTSSVQPYFEGGTVEDRIFEGAWTGQPIGMPAVLQMSLEAMRGLQVLHEAPGGPIIHNAMRPEQLLVYGNGEYLSLCGLWVRAIGLGLGAESCI